MYDNNYDVDLLSGKSLADLRLIAKALNIRSVTKYKKAELIDLITNLGKTGAAEPVPTVEAEAPREEAPSNEVKEEPAASEPAASGPAAPAVPPVDYYPRRKQRPKKAINDPAPYGKQKDAQKPARQNRPYDRQQYDRQQYDRQQYDRNEYQRPQQPREQYREPYQPPYPQYQQQYREPYREPYQPNYPQYRETYPAEGEDPRWRQNGYYNAEYGTSNPAVPEMLEGGECGDAEGILEIANDGYGFLRCENYLPGPGDVYISNAQIRRFRLKNGDKVTGKTRPSRDNDKYLALLYITAVNDMPPENAISRRPFEDLVPIFPNERLTLDSKDAKPGERLAIRLIDLMAPIGKGQRGLIVSQPKAGKTTLLKNIANGITNNFPDVTLIMLLIDERPEEVTDIKRSIRGEVAYSTFDQLPENHTRLAELVLERAMRLVEQGRDVVILMDSITRLARAYNLTITPTGRTLSGGMDPAALYKPKRFFGAARNIENGGSLTVIATALVETGSRMDDMVYEEFKGTGNMEIHLDRKLSERRIFPAVDIYKSGTRRDELLLTPEEAECATNLRRMLVTGNAADVTEEVIDMLNRSETNEEFAALVRKLSTGYESQGYTTGRVIRK
ncbi:MAG: transcription termination factor Rho [Clostridiales bacterium]|nr:transcription termination factor Rho [Clostridiales bacterium]